MILLIDNYDSFSYNLYQLTGTVKPEIKVLRNDELTVSEIETLAPDHIIISPGPGRPEDAGIIIEAVRTLGAKIPIFGRLPGTSGNLRGIWRDDHLCETADARKTVRGDVRPSLPLVSELPFPRSCSALSLPGG